MCIEHIKFHNKRYDIYSSQGDYVEDTKMDSDVVAKWLVSCVTLPEKMNIEFVFLVVVQMKFSDYGFGGKRIYPHSNFGGKFPDDLSKFSREVFMKAP